MSSTVCHTESAKGTSHRHRRLLSCEFFIKILQYTPHAPSISCAASNPILRYAREYVAGQRAQHSVHRRGDLYLCWDPAQLRVYHVYSGGLEDLVRDLQFIGWWIGRNTLSSQRVLYAKGQEATMDTSETPQCDVESREEEEEEGAVTAVLDRYTMIVPLEVEVKRTAAGTTVGALGEKMGHLKTLTTAVKPQELLLELLTILSSSPFQTAFDSCLRSLCLTPRHLSLGPQCVARLACLTRLEKLEMFALDPWAGDDTQHDEALSGTNHSEAHDEVAQKLPLHLSGSLESLLLRNASLSNLDSLLSLTQLRRLEVCRSADLTLVGALGCLPCLESVLITNCDALDLTGDYSACRQLRHFSIQWCASVTGVRALCTCPVLEKLELRYCAIREGAAALAVCAGRLHSLNLRGCCSADQLIEAALTCSLPLKSSCIFAELEELDIGESDVGSLAGLSQAPLLRSLTVRECPLLEDLGSLGHASSLEVVDAAYCTGLRSIEGLAHCPVLRRVNLLGCTSLQDLSPLLHIAVLEEVVAPTEEMGGVMRLSQHSLDENVGSLHTSTDSVSRLLKFSLFLECTGGKAQ